MNEPNSVAVEMLSLQLLAGKDKHCKPLIPINELRHSPVSDFDIWPRPGTLPLPAALFNFTVPKNQCYIATYVSLFWVAANGSIDWNINQLPNTYWSDGADNFINPITPSDGINYFNFINAPMLMLFKELQKPQLLIDSTSLTPTVIYQLNARMNGYLAPMTAFSALKKFQTNYYE